MSWSYRAKYIREAPFDEAMRTFFAPEQPKPVAHTIWTTDFMGMATHNVPCPVCFDRHAIIDRDVTIGSFRQQFRPCQACVADGWSLVRLPGWLRPIVRAFRRDAKPTEPTPNQQTSSPAASAAGAGKEHHRD